MKYLLLSDIRFGDKVLKAGTISDLKQFDHKDIPAFLEARVIAHFTNELLISETIKNLDKLEEEIKENPIEVETKEEIVEQPKRRGRPAKNQE
jgi:hypothetical protein